MRSEPVIPTLKDALIQLCGGKKIQSGQHIEPLHAYCATRLVVEGGFPPEWVNPAPAFSAKRVNNAIYELRRGTTPRSRSETAVLGGIKYKKVDVTVVVPNVGPALAISAKNTGNAFRNLTNRMEEALGECTNVHLMYPGFVFGFLHVIKFNTVSDTSKQDASFSVAGEPQPLIRRYHEVLVSLSGRNAITDPGMRYEAVGFIVYRCRKGKAEIWPGYPPKTSPVHFSRFFQRLYDAYDLRYGYPDPDGPNIRKGWRSEAISSLQEFDRSSLFPWRIRLASK